MVWFEITQYTDKQVMVIINLLKTKCMDRSLWPTEITYNQGLGFISCEFKTPPIKGKYGIKDKPKSSGNPESNVILEIVHLVLVNLV